MHGFVRGPAARRPDSGLDGLTADQIQALVTRGRRLQVRTFNDAIDNVVARFCRWVS